MSSQSRFETMLNTLEDLSYGDWGTDRDPHVVAAIQLLRAGAEMRQSSKTELSEATRAWDAALSKIPEEEVL